MYLFNFIIIVLGCHIPYIQNDRINTAIQFSNELNSSIVWFLTGGIKLPTDRISEAKQMLEYFTDKNFIFIDDKAKNTAENFINLKKFLSSKSFGILPQIVITTSKFHKKRAEKIFKNIFYKIEPIWNLSNATCDYCETNERMFMSNIDHDLKAAFDYDIN
jgi:uncharacterized SAM-binding protein YcdF (DUF218 family)